MRLYETTSTVRQTDVAAVQQRAYVLRSKRMMLAFVVILAVVGVVLGIGCMKQNRVAAVLCFGWFAFAAAVTVPVGNWTAKRTAENLFPDSGDAWNVTTWFENDGIHRTDEDGDDYAYPLNKMHCACQVDDLLLFCTQSYSVMPVDLSQLTETDRKSLLERLRLECPNLNTGK